MKLRRKWKNKIILFLNDESIEINPLRPRKAKNEIKLMKLIWLNSCGPLGGANERDEI